MSKEEAEFQILERYLERAERLANEDQPQAPPALNLLRAMPVDRRSTYEAHRAPQRRLVPTATTVAIRSAPEDVAHDAKEVASLTLRELEHEAYEGVIREVWPKEVRLEVSIGDDPLDVDQVRLSRGLIEGLGLAADQVVVGTCVEGRWSFQEGAQGPITMAVDDGRADDELDWVLQRLAQRHGGS